MPKGTTRSQMRRSETHYTVVIINLLIASLTAVVVFRRVLTWISLARLMHLQIGLREVLLQGIQEISAFMLVLSLGLIGVWTEVRRKPFAVWINVGIPIALLGVLGAEYLLHGNDHPEENATVLFLVILPIALLALIYGFLYFREHQGNAKVIKADLEGS